jgi:hypothetical protein
VVTVPFAAGSSIPLSDEVTIAILSRY